jgi:hypothetical protein
MTEAMQVLRMLYRRAQGGDAESEETVLTWAAEQLALLLEGVEREAEGPPETPATATATASLNAEQIAQLNEDAKR